MISGFDHLVLTVQDIRASVAFYRDGLGMDLEEKDGRYTLRFAGHKINLHQAGAEISPHAGRPLPGSADFCLLSNLPPETTAACLNRAGIAILEGPVERNGVQGLWFLCMYVILIKTLWRLRTILGPPFKK